MIVSKRVLHTHGVMADHSDPSGPVGGGAGRLDMDLMELPDGRKVVVVTSAYQFGHTMFEIERAEWDRAFVPGLLLKEEDRKALSDLLAILQARRPEHTGSLFSGPIARGMEVLTKILNPEWGHCQRD